MKFFSKFADKFFKRRKNRRATDKNEKKRVSKSRGLFGNPLVNVLLMVALAVGLWTGFRFLNERRMSAHTQIQFADAEDSSFEGEGKHKSFSAQPEIFSGEVFNTSVRLREIGALGFAICLSVLDEARAKRQIPGSINNLFAAVSERDLMPPEIEFDGTEIKSPSSKIVVRYKLEPMQLELVSLPLDSRFGPALMLRFPLFSVDGKSVAYFQAGSVSNIELPPPFAQADEVIRAGWTLESWRGIPVDGNQDFVRMLVEEQENLKQMSSGAADAR